MEANDSSSGATLKPSKKMINEAPEPAVPRRVHFDFLPDNSLDNPAGFVINDPKEKKWAKAIDYEDLSLL